jgi:hypothetical protein
MKKALEDLQIGLESRVGRLIEGNLIGRTTISRGSLAKNEARDHMKIAIVHNDHLRREANELKDLRGRLRRGLRGRLRRGLRDPLRTDPLASMVNDQDHVMISRNDRQDLIIRQEMEAILEVMKKDLHIEVIDLVIRVKIDQVVIDAVMQRKKQTISVSFRRS